MSRLGYFFLFLIILVPLLALAYIFYVRIRAQRGGRTPPSFSSFIPFRNRSSSSSGGILNSVRSKFQSLTGSGSHRSGAYERPLGTGRNRGLDPDGAWDARVGDEADAYGSGGYYEEQELGLRSGGHGTELPGYGDDEVGRGRSISRDGPPGGAFIGGDQTGLDRRYNEVTQGGDPFGDHAERSELKGTSARPTGGEKGHQQQGSGGVEGDSPTERRSMFHENM
ncbi:MAG: hypothetical protein L6R35_004583 [Caloplaca aegaea]|nr:MAG: hypothetical protein L6R35_004583 [Caloplaca aegaea]